MREFAPYEIPGRWYKIRVRSTGSAYEIENSDISEAAVSGNSILLPHSGDLGEFHTIDAKIIPYGCNNSSATTYSAGFSMSNTASRINLPTAANGARWNHFDIYIRGFYEIYHTDAE